MIRGQIALLTMLCGVACTQSAFPAGAYTEEQAANGKQIYDQYCAECHHMSLKGSGHGPELVGPNFEAQWGAQSLADFISYNREYMPPQAAGSLSEQDAVNIVAHILQVNGAAAGRQKLRADSGLAVGAAIEAEAEEAPTMAETVDEAEEPKEPAQTKWESWEKAGSIAAAARSASGFVNREVENFRPVTEEMLEQPPAADWLSWRRTLDGQGYSPLDQVNRENVRDLKLAWALTMHEGSNQTTPLVHDGIMYLVHPENIIQAIEADTGTLIWEYAYPFPPESKTLGGPTRNIAIYQDKLFMATYDAAIVALDARSGKLLWRSVKADWSRGFTHTSGPIRGSRRRAVSSPGMIPRRAKNCGAHRPLRYPAIPTMRAGAAC